MKNKITKQRLKYLELTIAEVPSTGWSNKIFYLVEEKMNLQSGYTLILFEDGIKDLVSFYEAFADQEMIDKLTFLIKPDRIRERVTLAVRSRIDNSKSSKIVQKKLLKFYAKPQNVSLGLKNMWRTVDKIWYYAGDKSTDHNYYTKRALLSAVYSSTLIHYLVDKSEQHQKTWEFLDKRIANILKISNFKNIPETMNNIKNKIPFIRLIK